MRHATLEPARERPLAPARRGALTTLGRLATLAAGACGTSVPAPAADVLITNATVWTVDPDQPRAEAIAIIGARIVAVGSNDEIAAWQGPDTSVVDGAGQLVLPGFNDAHIHLMQAGRRLLNGQLAEAASPEARRPAAELALAHAARLGVTSATDMGTTAEDAALFMELAAEDALTLRLYLAPMETDWQDQANVGIRRGFGSAFLRLGALKGYVDGTLQSSTALFFEPYGDAPGSTGMLTEEFTPFEDARTRLSSADASGLQIALHAVGDRGVSMALDLYEELSAVDPTRDRRLRIEHAQHLVDADFDRLAELEVVASVQPYQAIDDGRWAEERIGSERARGSYAYQTLLDRGARLALGTDWDAGPLDPMLTLHAAVTRATLDGWHPDGWMPAQKLTLEDAVEAYTLGSAYAEFQESEKGSVTVGKLADL
ncbi:MAG: amidohydrolase family protein, partial [Vicinamibacterales bacterium]|nr:amidohydrolase family protein [Vicinamibacterales bacterium]